MDQVRAAEADLQIGHEEKIIQPCEREVRRISRQSVCAVRDLPVGTVIDRQDVTIKRPGTGIPAAKLSLVIGRKLRSAVKANHLLHEEDLAA